MNTERGMEQNPGDFAPLHYRKRIGFYGNSSQKSVKSQKSKTASFVVKNGGKTNLSVSSAVGGTDASMFPLTSGSGNKTIKPGKALTIKVGFKPTSAGLKSATLKITSSDQVAPTLDVKLSGTGQ